MCDAFILFFVSELEVYFEGILEDGMVAFDDLFKSHLIRRCRASSEFVQKMNSKRSELNKNNNANWSRIGHLFDFIGLQKEVHFPPDFWDEVDSVVKHRGDLAHKSSNLTIIEDRRNIIEKIENIIVKIKIFDAQYCIWHHKLRDEISRVRVNVIDFAPTF